MTTPKISTSRKNGLQKSGRLVYAGFLIFWMVLGGLMVFALQNFAELWNISKESQAMVNNLGRSNKNMIASEKTRATTAVTAKSNNPNDIFAVGIMFADKEKYVDSLQAEVDTWLSEIASERIFAVGPAHTIANKKGFPRVAKHRCQDRSLWCKRIQHIPEAYNLLKSGIHFDWLLSGNEDWYVNLPAMREAFADKDPNDPVVYATQGCGFDWQHNPGSQNGTRPMPQGYRVNPEEQCEAISQRGGICGGYGIVFSRGAIETMMRDGGEDAIFNTTKSQRFRWNTHPQGDPVLSCLIYAFEDRGVRMEEKPWAAQDARYILKAGNLNARGGKSIATSHGVPFDDMTGADILRKLYDVQKSEQ